MRNEYKIINDPVHGFITIPSPLLLRVIEHPWFQRLRDIKQLGFTNLVYPGATHSRLSHALGAMYLMREAIAVLREKGVVITNEEEEGAAAAILLHDIGHGPYSHALERRIVLGIGHEKISQALIEELNSQFKGDLEIALSIFKGEYPKQFLHQLLSGQLDTDRLDYLKRDSFFSGVAEGMIGLERIIKMINVHDNQLVVEEKGLYSIEKFLISRRLMYWQVYLHKTVVAAEQLIIAIVKRARELFSLGKLEERSSAINYFFSQKFTPESFAQERALKMFTSLDDTDIMAAIKQWQHSSDPTLSLLCKMLTERRLPKLTFLKSPLTAEQFELEQNNLKEQSVDYPGIELSYFISTGEVSNYGYHSEEEILIKLKSGECRDIYQISDMLSAKAFSQVTKKDFLCRAYFNL